MHRWNVFVIAMMSLLGSTSLMADTVTLTPSKDNTIFSQNDAASNALGILFTSTTGQGNIRRCLLDFDVAAQIPAGSTVTSASLTLTLSQASPGSGILDHSLHRLLQDWGEGTSSITSGNGAPATPGDTTWAARFFPDTLWSTPGGDFVATPSASALVGETLAPITWGSTPEMVADVQSWLDSPGDSYGWIVLGSEDVLSTARKFVNREDPDPAIRPMRNIPAGGGSSCTITNTVFFEGIPTLGEVGLAVLALLMLGVGFVGLRRSGLTHAWDRTRRSDTERNNLRRTTSAGFLTLI